MTKVRWTRKEVRLAKDALMEMKGNKTKAAAIVSELTGRTHSAVMVKMCQITDTYPSLSKKSIARKEARLEKKKKNVVANNTVKVANRVEMHSDHIRIYF
jgi:hypothetical protein